MAWRYLSTSSKVHKLRRNNANEAAGVGGEALSFENLD